MGIKNNNRIRSIINSSEEISECAPERSTSNGVIIHNNNENNVQCVKKEETMSFKKNLIKARSDVKTKNSIIEINDFLVKKIKKVNSLFYEAFIVYFIFLISIFSIIIKNRDSDFVQYNGRTSNKF
ncbi:hypothetical protein PIROE2DRAFT_14052 [Piromyces sp. E2]|nr:hypothetical protein PIROE2DRAFT_14052 [Piromyces sp. E2]|eukprot:OUM60236.1 hypothetical protein PIROE2DRAFT_14052 [Piromyces sp. E2]